MLAGKLRPGWLPGLLDQMPEVPDSIGQHDHADFQKKGGAETAGKAEPVAVRLYPFVVGCP